MKTRHLMLSLLLLAGTITFFSCEKNNSSGNSNLRVMLTDAPVAYDSVNIDIREVRVNLRNDSAGWVSLNTNAAVYNLLGLQNGVDTLLATGTVQAGTLQEIRFILGPNNTVVVGGVSFPLTVPSGAESGLKIKVGKNISAGIDSITVDFDAALSIKLEPGGYKLRPVLKIK